MQETQVQPWVGKILWKRKWQPTPVFFLENPTNKGAWKATVHGVTKSWPWLSTHTRCCPSGGRLLVRTFCQSCQATAFVEAGEMSSEGGSGWHSTARATYPCRCQSQPTPQPQRSRVPAAPESFWGATLGNNLLHVISTAPHHSSAFIRALASLIWWVTYCWFFYYPASAVSLDSLAWCHPVWLFPQCGFLPLSHSFVVMLVGIGERVKGNMRPLCHRCDVHRCSFTNQQVVWVLPSSHHPSSLDFQELPSYGLWILPRHLLWQSRLLWLDLACHLHLERSCSQAHIFWSIQKGRVCEAPPWNDSSGAPNFHTGGGV